MEDLEATSAQLEQRAEAPTTPRTQPARCPLPDHLPREVIRREPDSACGKCGGSLRVAGEDTAEMLEYVPASFKVIRHVRPKMASACCQEIAQVEAPSRPIARGLAGPGLLAHVRVSKYADHLPLYRQSGIYEREGVQLERSTLADWVGQTAALLEPLAGAIERNVMAGEKIHTDDTPVPVLQPRRKTTKTSRLWTYLRDDRPAAGRAPPAVWMRYTPDRKGEHPVRHIARYRGILQADSYAGFDALYEQGGISDAACWAHVRRKFYDISEASASPIADEAIKRTGELYEIESRIRGLPPNEQRQISELEAASRLMALREWLTATLTQVSAKSAIAVAIRYALTRWPELERYASDGRIEIDNNAAERSIRDVALGRKNYLFAGSDAGGERAATIYSLLGTAKLNGIDPSATREKS